MAENQGEDTPQARQQLGQELRRLQEQYQASEGNKVLADINAFGNSFQVFIGNHAEFKAFLEYVNKPDVFLYLWEEAHRERLDEANREVVRLLHNYVSAIFSLVESTRAFVTKNYSDAEFFEAYKERVKENFAESTLHRFLQGLRNYTMHRRLPATQATLHFSRRDEGGFDFDNSFYLDVDKLREWDGWDQKAREYLKTLDSTVNLSDLIDTYAPTVVSFHQWLGERLGEEHTEAFQELLELETRLKQVELDWRAAWDSNGDKDAEPSPQQSHSRSEVQDSHREPTPSDLTMAGNVKVDGLDKYSTIAADVKELGSHEDAEIRLFEAPFDGIISNVTFTPSKDVQGKYYSRQLDLRVHTTEGGHRAVSTIQLGSDEILLPSGEKHNAHLLMPPTSLPINQGDYLVWSSIGSVGEGLVVPSGQVEIVFEQKDIADGESLHERWRQCVPEYWRGKKVLIEYQDQDVHGPNRPTGEFSTYVWEDVGIFLGADSRVLQIAVDAKEHGRLPRDTGYRYEQVTELKLMENQQQDPR